MYIEGMTPSSVFQTLAPTKTSGDLVDFGEYVYLCGESTQDLIGTGLHRLHVSDTVKIYQDKNRKQLVGNYLEVF
jgi:hypothetical protein